MSLTIKEALNNLGTALHVDMSKAPASNIADTIDYITEQVSVGTVNGDHTGVIAPAVDKFSGLYVNDNDEPNRPNN